MHKMAHKLRPIVNLKGNSQKSKSQAGRFVGSDNSKEGKMRSITQ